MEPVPVWQDYVWPQPDGTVRLLYAPNQRTEFAVPERGPMDTPASFQSSSSSSSSPKKVVSKKRERLRVAMEEPTGPSAAAKEFLRKNAIPPEVLEKQKALNPNPKGGGFSFPSFSFYDAVNYAEERRAAAVSSHRPASPILIDDNDDDDDDDEPRPASAVVTTKRGRVTTVKGAWDRYLKEYGGGNITALKKRIEETLEIRLSQAGVIADALKNWLQIVWFAQEPNREAPTIDDVVESLQDTEVSRENWTRILRFETVVPKKRVAKPVSGTVQEGRVKLRLRIQRPLSGERSEQFMEMGLVNWDGAQPLAFVSDLGGTTGEMTTLLNSQIPESLGIELTQLRVTQPYMLGKAWKRKGESLFLYGNPYAGRERNSLEISEFEEQASARTLSFLPLQAKRKKTGIWTDFSVDWDIEKFRDVSFTLPEESKLKGQIFTIPFRSQNAPQYQIVFALYYADPERIHKVPPVIVGVYIFTK